MHGNAATLHAGEHLGQRVLAQATKRGPNEEELVAVLSGESLENLHCALRQRDAVLAATLDSSCRDGPELLGEIYFSPLGAGGFVGAGRGENQELQGADVDTLALA
jgi:hypothetical protein